MSKPDLFALGFCAACGTALLAGRMADKGAVCGRCAVKNSIRKVIAKKSEGPIMDYLRTYAPQFADYPEPDLTKCPKCGGPADNGHDRSLPPNPYWCKRCTIYYD